MEEGNSEKRPLFVNYNGGNSESSPSSPFTFAVFLGTFSVYLGAFAVGTMLGFSSPAQSGIISELGLTLSQYSIFVSIYLAGAIFGAIWTGKIADQIGRRGAMQVVNVICILGWLVIAFAKGTLWLDVGRFLLGFGCGLCSYGGSIYIAEIIPKNVRGAVMTSTCLLERCGNALSFLIGPIISWRNLALIGIVPFLLQFLCLLVVPESPRWLMKVGKVEESEKALRRFMGASADTSHELAEIKESSDYSKSVSGDGVQALFQRKYRHCLIIGVGLVAFQQFGGSSGVGFYTSSIFNSAGFSGKIGSILVGATQVVSSIAATCVVDKFGRRPLLLISSIGTCFGCFIIGLSFLFQSLHFGEQISPVLALAGILLYMGLFSLGMDGIPMIISSEIYPINIKGAAGSIINVVSLGGGWIVSITFNFMLSWSSSGTFFIFAAICGASVVFIWKMVPETKGRSLEDIQASINGQ